MKKTVFLIILGVITIGCICWGTIRHVGGYDVARNSGKDKTINQTLESFSSINIDAGAMAIVIEEGSEFKIEGHVNKEYLIPEISVKNGSLTITQNKKKPRFRTGYENSRVVIEIPSGTELRSIDVDSGAGDLHRLPEAGVCRTGQRFREGLILRNGEQKLRIDKANRRFTI